MTRPPRARFAALINRNMRWRQICLISECRKSALDDVVAKVPFHVSFSVAEIVIYMQGLHQTAPFPQNKELV